MRRRSRAPKDSLDLLLDTMCNAFGGIVLIAILIALLIESPGDESRKNASSGKETLEVSRKARDLAELEAELRETAKRWEENKDLLELLQKRNQLAKMLSARQETEALSSVELNERLGKALELKSLALTEISSQSAELAAVAAKIDEQKRLLEQLENQMKELVSSRTSETHPPKLRDASGGQYNLIVQYGELYPVANYEFRENGELYGVSENNSSITWSGDAAIPIQGKGLKLGRDTETLKAILRGISNHNKLLKSQPSQRIYIVSFVYGDSFSLIDQLREIISEAGFIEDGWEPRLDGETLAFSSEGKRGQTD